MAPRAEGALMRVRVAALLLMVGLVAPSRWPRGRVALAAVVAVAFALGTSLGPLDSTPRAVAANPGATVIAKYRARIPALMAEQGVPGLAVALVGRDRVLWVEGSRAAACALARARGQPFSRPRRRGRACAMT
jgi:hypothetical protein